MNWEKYRFAMEQYSIKTDNMASEDSYFMATHMPFSNLEVIHGGHVTAPDTLMNEEEVYKELVWNPDNVHRLLIVRGDNGTGKSHLIRYLKARFENDADRYNSETEQIIFLRRLNNSIRGAFSQLLDQKVIKDPDVKEKLQKFVASTDSKDEEAFKTDIYHAYAALVMNDKEGDIYKPVICKNIAQFLYDSRVQEHLFREGGAISRCYQFITGPNDKVLNGNVVFKEADFTLDRKALKDIVHMGSAEARDFANSIKVDKDEVAKLVRYLNRFTPLVIQKCADISSESAKTVFEQLRRELKKQSKNLTLFIEDFTGFTGIDSELITVLSTEHGGIYEDLCRVTAIIGITDGYYNQFKDNFKDRVTYQINVTERSYGNINFLSEMAARYLNTIFCETNDIRKWFTDGAKHADLPISLFTAPCPWDMVHINEKKVTLYPFNRKSLSGLYDKLSVKTPRMFLLQIRDQLKAYFDGKEYGDNWTFPSRTTLEDNIQMKNAAHSSNIDRQDTLSTNDKVRLKCALEIWGDGSGHRVQKHDGIYIGDTNKEFFEDIGLGAFTGIGEIRNEDETESSDESAKSNVQHTENHVIADPAASRRQRDLKARREDIQKWLENGSELQFSPDYRKWLLGFIKDAINWQAEGISPYIAASKLPDQSIIFIEGQSGGALKDKALLILDKSIETKDVLLALCEYEYAEGWLFPTAAYFQQKVLNWLEKNRTKIVSRVLGIEPGKMHLPIIEWCLAVQYLKAQILGIKIDMSSPLTIIKSLFMYHNDAGIQTRETQEWSDVIEFIRNEEGYLSSCYNLLKYSSNTHMGAISQRPSSTPFYRTEELMFALQKLTKRGWNIEDELPEASMGNTLLSTPASMLRKLYQRVGVIVSSEEQHIAMVCEKIKGYIGELTVDNLVTVINSVKNLYITFNANSIPYSNTLKSRFDIAPLEKAKNIMNVIEQCTYAKSLPTSVEKLALYSSNIGKELSDFLKDLTDVELLAHQEQEKAERELRNLSGDLDVDSLVAAGIARLEVLYDNLEEMEVI